MQLQIPFRPPVGGESRAHWGYYDMARIAAGGLFTTAAALKAHEYLAAPFGPATAVDKAREIASVELELALGLWMLSGLFARLSRLISVACFGGFAAISVYKTVNGDASCGCFGGLSLRPWHMVLIDAAAIAALLRWRPMAPSNREDASFGVRVLAFVTLLMWPGLTLAYLMNRPVASGERVVLRPEHWRGRCLPLLPYIDIGPRLAEGRWTLLLYRRNCEACRVAISAYREKAQASGRGFGAN